MSPSELLRELHEGNLRMQRILDDLRILELRHWTMTDAERAEFRRREAEDQADRELRLDDDWTRRR
jgi:hypothetical protein